MVELQGLRSDLRATDAKRDAILQQGSLNAQALESLAVHVQDMAARDEQEHKDLRVDLRAGLEEVRISVEVLRVLLVGDKTTAGALVRIDRIEQRQERSDKVQSWLWGVVGAVVASLFVALAIYLANKVK